MTNKQTKQKLKHSANISLLNCKLGSGLFLFTAYLVLKWCDLFPTEGSLNSFKFGPSKDGSHLV